MLIEFLGSQHVLDNDKTLFNSNNHWSDDVAPVDYEEVLSSTHSSSWLDKFHTNYSKIVIPNKCLRWLKAAAAIDCQTGNFPSSYREDLDDMLTEMPFIHDDIPVTGTVISSVFAIAKA